MSLYVAELRDFYAKPLGHLVHRLIGSRIRAWWPDVHGESVYGLGYAAPFLDVYRHECARLGALMPARQGVLAWPSDGNYQSLLVHENQLPLPDASVDRLLLVHCLEMSESTHELLREVWRVLTPQGRLLVVAPNRRGIWARFDTTPFGHGRPYSRGQLRRLLTDALFTPINWEHALFVPPANLPMLLQSAMAWERLGAKFWPAFSGAIMVEAQKEIYAPIGGEKARQPAKAVIPISAIPFIGPKGP